MLKHKCFKSKVSTYPCWGYEYFNLTRSKSLIHTSASYSNIWLPFMWWHFSMMTGPFRRDTSRHRSSVRISLSAVYENTYTAHSAHTHVITLNKFSGVDWNMMVKIVLNGQCVCVLGQCVLTWFPPIPWQLKKPTFSFSFLPMLSTHWLVSTFLICGWSKAKTVYHIDKGHYRTPVTNHITKLYIFLLFCSEMRAHNAEMNQQLNTLEL